MLSVMHDSVKRMNGKLQADIHRVYMHAACYYACLAVKRVDGDMAKDVGNLTTANH